MKQNITNCIIFAVALLTLFCFSDFDAKAEDNFSQDEYNIILSEYDLSFFDELDDDSKSILESFGLLDFDYERIINFSAKDMFNEFIIIVSQSAKTPLKSAAIIFIIISISSFFRSIKEAAEESELSSSFSSISALIIALLLLSDIKSTIAVSAVAISVCADFIYAFVPAFCVIVAASGSTVTALSTNAVLLSLGQALNYISKNVFLPLSNCFLALGICSGIRSELNLESLISTFKKYITGAISICATAFISVLSIRTAVASKADAIGLRSVRFAINSVVPVIGGAISEGLLSIQAYSSLIKSSVGIVGIISVAVLFLPSIVSVSLWRFFLSLCSVVSDVFSDNSVSCVLKAFANALLIINVILILSMVTTIISIGILVAARGSGA